MTYTLIAAFTTMIICMAFLHLHQARLLRKSWRREKDAIGALDTFSKAFDNYRESQENLVEAYERNAVALQERINILESALRERGVNV